MKQCTNCGLNKDESAFRLRKKSTNDKERWFLVASCNDCERAYGRKHDTIRTRTPRGIFKGYKHHAKERDISFGLTFDTFDGVIKQPCIYCGGKNDNGYCGIDRLNSSIGYEIGNIASCCTTCNDMKMEHSVEFMIQHMFRILQHLQIEYTVLGTTTETTEYNKLKVKQIQSIQRFRGYKSKANSKGLLFNLSSTQFDDITKQPCVYCGAFSLYKDYCGIDRFDNSRGYELGNAVSCCTACNCMKLDHTVEFMIQHIIKVLMYMKKIDSKEIVVLPQIMIQSIAGLNI